MFTGVSAAEITVAQKAGQFRESFIFTVERTIVKSLYVDVRPYSGVCCRSYRRHPNSEELNDDAHGNQGILHLSL